MSPGPLSFRLLLDPADLRAAADILRELRPQVAAAELPALVDLQGAEGWMLLAAEVAGQCVGLAGYRVQHMLARGRHLYVDDLVVGAAARGRGVGTALLAELERRARALGCASIELDSGLARREAHAFYAARGYGAVGLHFRRSLGTDAGREGRPADEHHGG